MFSLLTWFGVVMVATWRFVLIGGGLAVLLLHSGLSSTVDWYRAGQVAACMLAGVASFFLPTRTFRKEAVLDDRRVITLNESSEPDR